MNYRIFPKIQEIEISTLGFGFMRLPLISGTNSIDEEATRVLVKTAIDQGINYFDTAYPYHDGKSEVVLGRILEEEKLRDKIFIADKCPVWEIKHYEDFDRILEEQLSRLRTDHIDFYLLHALYGQRWEEMKNLGVIDFLEKAKKSGKIRHIGFSFHDSIEAFQKIIDAYEGWEFCQIQYNYLDNDGMKTKSNPGWQALSYASKKEIGVVIMEPLRGGLLANPPAGVRKIFAAADKPRIPAEWGLRYVWENQEVITALSGMNTVDQILVNCAVASAAFPNSLPKKEIEVIEQAEQWFKSRIKVPCTACHYCVPCPKGVSIPDIFGEYNNASMRGLLETGIDKTVSTGYMNIVKQEHGADKCVKCGLCIEKCPQHIKIPDFLSQAHKELL